MNRVISILIAIVIFASPVFADDPSIPSQAEVRVQLPVSLKTAITFIEHPEKKAPRSIIYPVHLMAVDYKSELIILPDKNIIKKISASNRPVLPELSEGVQNWLSDIPKLIKAASDYVAKTSETLETLDKTAPNKESLKTDDVKYLQQKIVEQGKLGREIVDLIVELAERKAHYLYKDDTAAFDEEINRITESLLKANIDGKDVDVILNVEAFALFVAEEINFAKQIISKDVEAANKSGIAQLRMKAWLKDSKNKESAVGIKNYYEVKSYTGPKRPRVAFRMTEEEQQRVEQGLEIANDAAKLIEEFQEKKEALLSQLQKLQVETQQKIKKLHPAIDAMKKYIISDDELDTIDEIIAAAEQYEDATDNQKKALKELKSFFESFNKDIQSIHNGYVELIRVTDNITPARLTVLFSKFPEKIQNALNISLGYPGKLHQNFQNIEILFEVLAAMTEAEATTRLAEAKNIIDGFVANTKKLLEDYLEDYAALSNAVMQVVFRSQVVEMADVFESSANDPRIRALSIDDIRSGFINLDETPADHGDNLYIDFELFTLTENGEEHVIDAGSQTFEIERFGLTDDFSANLIFIDRIGKGSPSDPETNFKPVPSASWTLHYNIRVSPGDSWLRGFYRFLDPGIGINTTAMDFENKNLQFGIGAHVTLFQNLLIFGYGYNLQASKDNEYYYLGIGILETMNTVGSLFGK